MSLADAFPDWMTNLEQFKAIIPHQLPSQYIYAKSLVAEYKRLYTRLGKAHLLRVTGHSLGGGLANYAASVNGVKGVGINSAPLGMGAALDIFLNNPSGYYDNTKFVHYNNHLDIVSNLPGDQIGTVVTLQTPSGLNPIANPLAPHLLKNVAHRSAHIFVKGPLEDHSYFTERANRPSI